MAAVEGKEKQVETVTMTDGRKVDFAGKRRMLKEVLVEGTTVSVRYDFRNGNTVTLVVPEQHKLYAAGHGYAQKTGDTVAGLKDDNGNPASEEDMQLEIEGLHERLQKSQEWNTVREGGGFAGLSMLARALAEVYPAKSKEEIKAFLGERSVAEKQALRKSSKLAPVIQRLEGERDAKAAKVDTEALLAQIQ